LLTTAANLAKTATHLTTTVTSLTNLAKTANNLAKKTSYQFKYRVAAINPEHFQSFTVALKNHIFY
jgi:hypothetical protein